MTPPPPPSLDEFNFRHALRVRWAEVDAQGVVFNPNYLAYADIAFTEYMRAIHCAYPNSVKELGIDVVAVAAELNFRAPAGFDDELVLAARVIRIGRTSFGLAVALFRGEQALVDIAVSYVGIGLADGRPALLPSGLIERINAFENGAEVGSGAADA